MTVKSVTKELLRLEREVRDERKLEDDDLVFLTICPQDKDLFFRVLRAVPRSLFVLDVDRSLARGKYVVTHCRIDKLLNGEG